MREHSLVCAVRGVVLSACGEFQHRGGGGVPLYGAAFAAGRDSYVSVLAAGRKNYGAGVRERQVVVSEDAPLVRLFHHVDGRSVTTFRVVRENGGDPDAPPQALYTLTEPQLRALAASGKLSRSVGRCVRESGAPVGGHALPPGSAGRKLP